MLDVQEVAGHPQDDDAVDQQPDTFGRSTLGTSRHNDHD